jgi:hydrogenase nickel incorporation protein HypA/HybF
MHELAITQSMYDLVMEEAEKASAKKVEKINLVLGEMTGVVDDCVEFYFNLLSKGSIAEEAKLSIRKVPPRARCRNCNQTFELREHDWSCPHCEHLGMEIVAGQELYVESIEVE